MADERAVSVPTNYAIVLAIVTVLSTGLVVTTAEFVDTQHEQAVRSGLDVTADRLANDLATADRLAAMTTDPGGVNVSIDLPRNVAGRNYLVDISPSDGETRLTLRTSQPAAAVTTTVPTTHTVVPTTVSGGGLVITYDSASDSLEVHHA